MSQLRKKAIVEEPRRAAHLCRGPRRPAEQQPLVGARGAVPADAFIGSRFSVEASWPARYAGGVRARAYLEGLEPPLGKAAP